MTTRTLRAFRGEMWLSRPPTPFAPRPTPRASRARSAEPILRNARMALANLRGRSLTTTDLAARPALPNAILAGAAGLSLRAKRLDRANTPARRRGSPGSSSLAGSSTSSSSAGSSITTRAVLLETFSGSLFRQVRRTLTKPFRVHRLSRSEPGGVATLRVRRRWRPRPLGARQVGRFALRGSAAGDSLLASRPLRRILARPGYELRSATCPHSEPRSST